MFKNVASQKVIVYAFDSTTNLPKTGDAANLTAYVSKDYGAVTVLGDTSATEMDSTNAKGYYLFDLTQAETNADTLLFSCKSSTANIVVVGSPATVTTVPSAFGLVAGASGGLLISGSNAGTTTLAALTVTGSLTISDGLLVSRSTSNASAITATGNGTGHGIAATSGSGATGNGITLLAASTNGHGLKSTGTGTGDGFELTAGASGADLDADQVGTFTGNITGNLSGSVGSVTGAVGSVTGAVGSVTGAVGSVTGAVGSVTGNVGGNVVGSVASVTGNVGGNVVGSVASVTAGVTLANNSMTAAASAADFLAEINAEVDTAIADVGLTTTITGRIDAAVSTRATPAQILTTALTEAYAADGAAGTLSQILFGLQAFLQERAVAGTTVTVKKLDGSTSAMTFTLNDGTSPTSITRAT